jgi:hypothetical protein
MSTRDSLDTRRSRSGRDYRLLRRLQPDGTFSVGCGSEPSALAQWNPIAVVRRDHNVVSRLWI